MKYEPKFFKCEKCGNIVGLIKNGGGTLTCCGSPMKQLVANSVDASGEKHVPVVVEKDGKRFVTVGSVAHPMTEEHFIEWIYVVSDKCAERYFLSAGDVPEVEILIQGEVNAVYAYCNLHGLWKA